MAIFYTDSGSFNDLEVTGSVRISGSLVLESTQNFNVTGSVFGTASWASNAVSSSFATTASAATSITFTPSSSSFATTASFAVSASYAPGGTVTSIAAGNGLAGGTITSTGTISLDTSSVHFLDGVKKELNTEGVISSSTQFNSLTAPFTGSFTGSFAGTITSAGTGSFGAVLPPSDNTGVVGNTALTWANGQFTNLTVDNQLSVNAAIQLAQNDELRMGGATSFVLLHDGTNNIIRSNESNLQFNDSTTNRITFFRTTGAISASGGVTASGFFGTSSRAQSSSVAVSSSFATTSSFAISASWAPSAPGGGVTSVTAGNGLTGGEITSTGTITLDTSSVHFLDGVKKELNTEGVISSSLQFNSLTSPFTGSFTGSFSGSLDRFNPPALRITVGTTAPSSPATNDLWVDTN